jgi:hypothetical protein
MKNIFYISFMAYVLLSCSKEVAIKDQTVFENLGSIPCFCDTLKQNDEDCKIARSDTYDLIDVEGKLYSAANYYTYIDIVSSAASKVPQDRFPLFEKRNNSIVACNMPKELSSKDFDGARVKLSCRLFYEPLPWPGRSIPQADGYGVELLRIELLE